MLLTAAYLWGSWQQTSREAWNELQALSNLAQATAQIHFQQYARGMEQLAAQALEAESTEVPSKPLSALILPFLQAYPDLSGVLLVRPDGKLLESSARPDGETAARFNENPQLMKMLAAARGHKGLQFFPPIISPLIDGITILGDTVWELQFFPPR